MWIDDTVPDEVTVSEKKIRKRRSGRQAVTVHDVARHAGVSSMTVSRVINKHPTVADEIRQRVEASIEALRFIPSTVARNLASARALRIGFPYTNPRASYNGELLVGVLDGASRGGNQLLVERSHEGRELEAVIRLLNSGVDGLILPPRLSANSAVVAAIEQSGTPWVTISEPSVGTHPLTVMINDFQAARDATAYLIELGHCNIGFIRGHPELASSKERFRGFCDALSVAGLDNRMVAEGFYTFDSGMEAATQLLIATGRPTAIFAANDDMAAATLSAAHRMGLSVPDDLTIFGFDDTPICTTIWPNLSTIHIPITDMARAAVAMLVAEISSRRAGNLPRSGVKTFPFELIKRGSTSTPRV